MKTIHKPVMLKEVIDYLAPKQGGSYIDCTLGGGSYALEIARKIGKKGMLIGLDADKKAIARVNKLLEEHKITNTKTVNENFVNLLQAVSEQFKKNILFDGIVFDLGISSDQLEDVDRGFSFKSDTPLKMAFDVDDEKSTFEIINKYSYADLARILREYGEEKFAGSIAGAIIKQRRSAPVESTGQLVSIIESAVPASYKRKKIHPATKTFQALRMETNSELTSLEKVLPDAISLLKSGGRIVVVSFHSLEDRVAKHFFKRESIDCLCAKDLFECRCGHLKQVKILTKKVVIPTDQELEDNPRARSAKLRAAEKI